MVKLKDNANSGGDRRKRTRGGEIMLDFIYKGFVHNGTAQNETRQNEVRSQGPSTQVIEEQRKFAYSKAIEAYWKHIDRYHTWMNYYSLFNGALFVGFCTLLTATSNIHISDCHEITLSNQYESLQIFVCLLGLLSSICWLGSLIGHQKWEENWMNIVCKYEDTSNRIYSLLRTKKDDMNFNERTDITLKSSDPIPLQKNEYYKGAFSTHVITTIFIWLLIISWLFCLIFIASSNCKCLCDDISFLKIFSCICKTSLVLLIPVVVLIIMIFLYFISPRCNMLLSNVEGKYWESKDEIDDLKVEDNNQLNKQKDQN